MPHGYELFKRLIEHSESISSATNLSLSHFRCRWLVVDDVFIPLGKSLLISHFKPLWNIVVVGFGNHPPGAGRGRGKKPTWDVLHPGRAWANTLAAGTTREQVIQQVAEFMSSLKIPSSELPG